MLSLPGIPAEHPDCPTRFLEETVWMSGGWMVGETGGGGSDDVEEEEAGITLG